MQRSKRNIKLLRKKIKERKGERESREEKKYNKGKTNFMVQILSWVEIKTTGEKSR